MNHYKDLIVSVFKTNDSKLLNALLKNHCNLQVISQLNSFNPPVLFQPVIAKYLSDYFLKNGYDSSE